MKKCIKTIIITLCFFGNLFHSNAQQVNTMYFLENAPVRHYLNPAFQPLSNFYLSLPVIGYTQFDFGTNNITLNDLNPNFNTNPYKILSTTADKTNFYNRLAPTTYIGANLNVNLLSFGFRKNNTYWTVGVTEKMNANIGIPKDVFKLGIYGTDNIDKLYDFKNTTINSSIITEFALGYSNKLNDRFSVGGKFKILHGTANINLSNKSFSINTNEPWIIDVEGTANIASPAVISGADLENLEIVMPDFPKEANEFTKPKGLGVGVDLGATFMPIDRLTLSAAITDFGFINWKNNATNIDYTANYTITGMNTIDVTKIDNSTNYDGINVDGTSSNTILYNTYTTNTVPKLNIGAEYGFYKNKLSLGLLSRTIFQQKTAFEELTASVNGKPTDWFNLSVSYSAINGRFSNIGAGMGVRVGFINFFVTADYIPLSLKTISLDKFNSSLPEMNIPFPIKSQKLNVAVGFNLVFGNKKDKDKDGIKDSKDECPQTPLGVIVDEKGCPVDSDGDGVPDYIDKCSGTPPEAYNFIDQFGCLMDTDGDGIFDYLDKCPNTPAVAFKFLDENGCEKDTDNDGIFDYLDKCPDTPTGVVVDSIGCPLDTDGDGIADYLDKCPNTPVEARGMIDQNGCPLDSDNDSVPDYLDKCPDTPAEAIKSVDSNGCNVDTDEDGVPDYLDKCPDTPVAARSKVDINGCPKDTDNDGIFDYLDNCPKLFGVAANNGCPEIKTEIRKLFQKALLGIQFESGKDLIRTKSFSILNEIAKQLINNPTYLIEIRGHTDNVGKAEMNKDLSERRALSVKNYLIGKGVPEKRMTSNGFGDTLPVATNKTTAGRALNRRVEFIVTFEEVTFE